MRATLQWGGESEAKEATDNIQPQAVEMNNLISKLPNSKDTTNLVGLNVIFFGVDVEMDN